MTELVDVIEAANLTPPQRNVIFLLFGVRDGKRYTQSEVAEFLGITQQGVSKHKKAAMKKLVGVVFPE